MDDEIEVTVELNAARVARLKGDGYPRHNEVSRLIAVVLADYDAQHQKLVDLETMAMSGDEKTVNIPLDDPRIDKMRRNLDPDSMTDGEKYDALNMLRKCIRAQHPPEPELEPGRFYLATCTGDGERAVIVASDRPDRVHAVYAESGHGANVTMPVFKNIRPLVEQTPEAAAVLEEVVRLHRDGGLDFPAGLDHSAIAYRAKSIGGAP